MEDHSSLLLLVVKMICKTIAYLIAQFVCLGSEDYKLCYSQQ